MIALMVPADAAVAGRSFHELLAALLDARTLRERIDAYTALRVAGWDDEWVSDDRCGRLYQVSTLLGHLQRTEPPHLARTLAETGTAVPLHTVDTVRYEHPQVAGARRWPGWAEMGIDKESAP